MDIPELKTQNLKFRTHSIGLIVDGTEQETGFLIYRKVNREYTNHGTEREKRYGKKQEH